MSDIFSRTQQILGKSAMEKLKNSRVAVFGIGGVGQYVVEALIRSGIGAIDLVDDDKVCMSNINRQLVATNKTIGRFKTEVMKEHILEINPDCKVTEHRCFYLPEGSKYKAEMEAIVQEESGILEKTELPAELYAENMNPDSEIKFEEFDYVVDAVDTVTAKIAIIMEAKEKKVPVISAMGAGNKINPAQLEVADISRTSVDPLAKVMRRELKKRGIKNLKVVYSKEKPMLPVTDSYENDMGIGNESNISGKDNVLSKDNDMDNININKNKSEKFRDTARKCYIRRATPGSVVFVPSVAGMIIGSEVVKELTGIQNDVRVI